MNHNFPSQINSYKTASIRLEILGKLLQTTLHTLLLVINYFLKGVYLITKVSINKTMIMRVNIVSIIDLQAVCYISCLKSESYKQ